MQVQRLSEVALLKSGAGTSGAGGAISIESGDSGDNMGGSVAISGGTKFAGGSILFDGGASDGRLVGHWSLPLVRVRVDRLAPW